MKTLSERPSDHEVVRDAEHLLERWRLRHADRPDLERERLWLLALEREQIVSVAYEQDLFGHRLERMPVTDDLREVIRHAMVWIWKDEEIHTDYIRGLLLAGNDERYGRIKTLRTFGRQIMGAVSGWATATRLHNRFADAPLAMGTASLLTFGGRATRKLSESMQAELELGPFRNYCLLNVALEDSAELCYRRLVEIAASDSERAAFTKIRDDERDHAALFSVLADSLGADDRLRPDTSVAEVVERVRAISEWLLPGAYRSGRDRRAGFGTAGRVWVGTGSDSHAKRQTFTTLLSDAGLADVVSTTPRPSIAIKTAFMMGYDRRDTSNVIDATLLDELACWLHEMGAGDLTVLESPTVYENWFDGRDVASVARYFGLDSELYRIVDTQGDQVPYGYTRGMTQASISHTWRDADVRIVLAKMRTNPTERGHLCLSSLEGLGERQDAFVFADRQLHYRAATMMLLDDFPPDFGIVDAYDSAADGLFGVMGCHCAPEPRRIYCGADVLTVDAVAMRDMGTPDPLRSPMLRTAQHWFGAPVDPVDVVGAAGPIEGFRHPRGTFTRSILSAAAYPVYVYGPGSGRMFTPAMDEDRFPPLQPPTIPVRLVRKSAQLAFGLRPPAGSGP